MLSPVPTSLRPAGVFEATIDESYSEQHELPRIHHPMTTRLKNNISKPKKFSDDTTFGQKYALTAEPTTHVEAL